VGAVTVTHAADDAPGHGSGSAPPPRPFARPIARR
jgi:hypothetical protein